MAPFWTFVAALATTAVAVSGVPLPSEATATGGVGSLRGGRMLQAGMCNSIGCPSGYTPIPDAMNVECTGGVCEVSQCCEAFCSYHPCPMNFIPIAGADAIMCPDSGCTDMLCCENVVTFTETTDDTDDEMTILTMSPTASPTASPTTVFT